MERIKTLITFPPSRQRRDSDQDTPTIEFTYDDRDSYLRELAELYSYSEVPEFQTTMDLFHTNLEAVVGVKDWDKTTVPQRRDFVMVMLDRFEVSGEYEDLEVVIQM